jgi:hypothetical protein
VVDTVEVKTFNSSDGLTFSSGLAANSKKISALTVKGIVFHASYWL